METMLKCIRRACCVVVLAGSCLGLAQRVEQAKSDVQSGEAAGQALAFERQGKLADALESWKTVVKFEPRNGSAYAHMGLIEARQDHYAEAIAYYKKAQALSVATKQAIPELNLNLGLAYFKSGNFRDAGKVFEADLARHPKGPDAARLGILVGMSHYGAREYVAAIPYLKEAAAADPKNLPLRLSLAHCYLWTKQFDATLGVYKEILTINPDSAEADMVAGEALDEKGDKSGAVQQFRAAVVANPKEPNVHFGLAYLLWSQKQYDDAIPEFKAELANDPENSQAMAYLGDTYVQLSQFEPALPLLKKALSYKTSLPLIHLDIGIALMETGDQEGAVQELNKAVALQPDYVAAHFRLAMLYRSMGKKDEAKAESVKASSLNKLADEGLHKRIADAIARHSPGGAAESGAGKPAAAPEKPQVP